MTRSSSCATSDGALHALHNTCRHRGMRVCDAGSRAAAHAGSAPTTSGATRSTARCSAPAAWSAELDAQRSRSAPRRRRSRSAAWSSSGSGADPQPLDAAQTALARRARAAGPRPRARRAPDRLPRRAPTGSSSGRTTASAGTATSATRSTCGPTSTPSPDTERDACAGGGARARDHARRRWPAGERPRGGAPAPTSTTEPGLYAIPDRGRWWSANRTPLAPGLRHRVARRQRRSRR